MNFFTKLSLCFFLCLIVEVSFSQIDSDAIFTLPKLTNAEMLGIITPNTGSLVYNTDDNSIYKFDGTNWVKTDAASSLKSVVLDRVGGYTLPNLPNRYFNFPINATHTQSIDADTFTVTGNGAIRVLKTGVYMISAELSTSNMPAGNTKYIIGAFRNGGLIGYLTRGSVSLPNRDWWGGTGVLMYNLNANDVINIRYVLNAGRTLNGQYMNIGITKIK